MILEVAVLNVRVGSEAAYEAAFERASSIIAARPGYISISCNAASRFRIATFSSYAGNRWKRTPLASAVLPSIRNGSACCIISTSRFPPLNTTSR